MTLATAIGLTSVIALGLALVSMVITSMADDNGDKRLASVAAVTAIVLFVASIAGLLSGIWIAFAAGN